MRRLNTSPSHTINPSVTIINSNTQTSNHNDYIHNYYHAIKSSTNPSTLLTTLNKHHKQQQHATTTTTAFTYEGYDVINGYLWKSHNDNNNNDDDWDGWVVALVRKRLAVGTVDSSCDVEDGVDGKVEEVKGRKGRKGKKGKKGDEEVGGSGGEGIVKGGGYMVFVNGFRSCSDGSISSVSDGVPLKDGEEGTDITFKLCKGGRQIVGRKPYAVHGCFGVRRVEGEEDEDDDDGERMRLKFRVTSEGCSRLYGISKEGKMSVLSSTSYKSGRVIGVVTCPSTGMICCFTTTGKSGYVNVWNCQGGVGGGLGGVRCIGRGKSGSTAWGGWGNWIAVGDERGRITVYKDLDKVVREGIVEKEVVHWHSMGVKGIVGTGEGTYSSVGGENVLVEWEVGKEKPQGFIPRVTSGCGGVKGMVGRFRMEGGVVGGNVDLRIEGEDGGRVDVMRPSMRTRRVMGVPGEFRGERRVGGVEDWAVGRGGKGGFVKGGSGEYVCQAWPGEVRRMGLAGDKRGTLEVKGGYVVKNWNRVSKKEKDGEEHVRPVVTASGKGEGITVLGVRRGEEEEMIVVEGERVKGVVKGKKIEDVDVGKGRFAVGTSSGVEVWSTAGEVAKDFTITEGLGSSSTNAEVIRVAIADDGTLVARSEGKFTSVWDDEGECMGGWGGEGDVIKLQFAGSRIVETRTEGIGVRGGKEGGWEVKGQIWDSCVVGQDVWVLGKGRVWRLGVGKGEDKGCWKVGDKCHAIGRVGKSGVVVVGDNGDCWGVNSTSGSGGGGGGGGGTTTTTTAATTNEKAPRIPMVATSAAEEGERARKRAKHESDGFAGMAIRKGEKKAWEGDVQLGKWRDFARFQLGGGGGGI